MNTLKLILDCSMSTIARALVLASPLLAACVAPAETTATAQAPGVTNQDEDTPAFLGTMTTTGGVRFTATSEGKCGSLSFQTTERMTIFTERPTRQAVSKPTSELVRQWADIYGDVPPNAHLQLFSRQGGAQNSILKLGSAPSWEEATKTVTFEDVCLIDIADDTQAREPVSSFEFGALFIDTAKAFAWNSCYPSDDNGDGDEVCLEQWGSYPGSCLHAGGVGHTSTARGKRCKQVCNVSTCPNGCFTQYMSGISWNDAASAYQCN